MFFKKREQEQQTQTLLLLQYINSITEPDHETPTETKTPRLQLISETEELIQQTSNRDFYIKLIKAVRHSQESTS